MGEKRNGEHFSADVDEDGLSVDWSTLFELMTLCPTTFPSAGDGDLERVYARCEQGCCIEGRVFS